MESKEAVLEQFSEDCRRQGLSVTAQRLAIYADIHGTDSHPTAEEVYGRLKPQFPSLSLATVYKTLDTFEKYEFVSKTRATGEKARYDANRAPHHHLICKQCGRIEDVYDAGLEALRLPEGGRHGFEIHEYRIDFRGLCENCRAGGKAAG